MNATRALGAILFVVGVGWFLAVPTLLPAAYHGHVHTGHEHAEFAAHPVDPGAQSAEVLVKASENAADASADRSWTAVRVSALQDGNRNALQDAIAGRANATQSSIRDRYRRLAREHPYVHTADEDWVELSVEDVENYTVLRTASVDTAAVTGAVSVSPSDLDGRTRRQVQTLARADGAVLVSGAFVPTPIFVDDGGQIHLVNRIGPAPMPPSLPALVLFLIPGVVLAAVGAYLGVRG